MLETIFLYMVFAIFLASGRAIYEGRNDLNEFAFWDVLYLPFLLGVAYFIYKKFAPKTRVLDLPDKYWKTQLSILADSRYKSGFLSQLEKEKRRFLKKRWLTKYDVTWEEKQMVKVQGFVPLLILVAVGFGIVAAFTF